VWDITYSDNGAYEDGKNKRKDVVLRDPQLDIDGAEYNKEGETPGDTVDDDSLASWEELVDDGSKKKQVNQGPRASCDSVKTAKNWLWRVLYQIRKAHGAGVMYVSFPL